MPDIRCRVCNAKLAERHGDRIEIKMKQRRTLRGKDEYEHGWVLASAPIEIICHKCGLRNEITDTSHQTEPANQSF